MDKELILEFLTLDAIKVAMEKYIVRIYHNLAFDYYTLSLYDKSGNNQSCEIYIGCKEDSNNNYCIKYYTRTYPSWSPEVDITNLEYEKVRLNLLIAEDYINSLRDEEMTNLIKEIVNEYF